MRMKSAWLFVAAVFVCSFSAQATPSTLSLEEALAQQTITEITPVNYQRMSVPVEGGPEVAMQTSANICKALGYARLVKFATEPCTEGEKFGYFLASSGASRFMKSERSCGTTPGAVHKRIASITCAK